MIKDLEKNITTITSEDFEFIRDYAQLPPEKKILINGIVIGLNYSNENENYERGLIGCKSVTG